MSILPIDATPSDEMDLLAELVKMLAEEIALGTSTLKRLLGQFANDHDSSKDQIESLECEIQEKRKQMRTLELRIVESGEASIFMKLMAQCSEKGFELEIESADNLVLQEQLQNRCAENKELQEKLLLQEQQLASISGGNMASTAEMCVSDDCTDELRKIVQSQPKGWLERSHF